MIHLISSKRIPEYNVNFVVCIGRSVINICKTATLLQNERMGPLDRPRDIDNYVAQFDQHQRIIYTQLKYDIRNVNPEKQMPHGIIVQIKLVGQNIMQDFIHCKEIEHVH